MMTWWTPSKYQRIGRLLPAAHSVPLRTSMAGSQTHNSGTKIRVTSENACGDDQNSVICWEMWHMRVGLKNICIVMDMS